MGTNPDDDEERKPPPKPFSPTYSDRPSGFEKRVDEPLDEPFEESEDARELGRREDQDDR